MPSRDPSTPRPPHRRTVSSMSAKTYASQRAATHYATTSVDHAQYEIPTPPTTTNKTATRLMTSMRRSLIGSTPKKRWQDEQRPSSYAMISTPAERTVTPSARYRDYSPTNSRPTIEQIAMGLHTSRTPHLRPLSSSPNPYSQRNSAPGSQYHASPYDKSSRRSASPLVLPPPPTRSSMKNRGTSNTTTSTINPGNPVDHSPASTSSSTVTSNNPPSSQSSISLIKFRMSRFLPKPRTTSAPPSMLSSPASSPRGSSDFHTTKKAVRFSENED